MAMAHAPGAVAGSSEGGMHTVLLPPVSPPVHKCLGWQNNGLAERWVHPAILKEVMETQAVGQVKATGNDNVAEMARTMDAARQCEIVADKPQALNADWGKMHNPWENVWPRQVKRWWEGQ